MSEPLNFLKLGAMASGRHFGHRCRRTDAADAGGRHLVLLMIVAGWAIARAALRIVAAIQLSKRIEGEWLLRMSGGLSVLFSLLLVAVPAAGILSLILLNGAWAVVSAARRTSARASPGRWPGRARR